MSPWFIRYNIFLKKGKYSEAENLLRVKTEGLSRSPLLYLAAWDFFYRIRFNPDFLRHLGIQALLFFPDSLLVKEKFLWIVTSFFIEEAQSTYLIHKYIFPILQPFASRKSKLYLLLGRYFTHRKVLDSAQLYIQMAQYYNTNLLWQGAIKAQELVLFSLYKERKSVVSEILSRGRVYRVPRRIAENLLLSQKIFWPSPTFFDTLKRAQYTLSPIGDIPKKQCIDRQKKGYRILFIALLLLVLLIFLLEQR